MQGDNSSPQGHMVSMNGGSFLRKNLEAELLIQKRNFGAFLSIADIRDNEYLTAEAVLGWLQHFIERNRRLRELWSTVPAGSVALFMGFAFCLFATVGALAQLNVRLDSLG